jgi:dihydropyrimidine dehydrogenase (NAD+) subunit PreA
MADLTVKTFGMVNPFVVASSPATQGARNVLKTAACGPGAIVLRNFGHGAGGGSFIYPNAESMYQGQASHSHAAGRPVSDGISTLEQYCEEVKKIKRELSKEIKLWVSVGHFSDIAKGGEWEKDWVRQAKELSLAGADALELHFNTPGVAAARDRNLNYYQLVYYSTKLIKAAVSNIPVMAKLAVEACDPFISIQRATDAGADAVGPTARWKSFYFELDWRRTQPNPGAGYGGTQANPVVCYTVAEARSKGIKTPMFAGGGVFSYEQALRISMSGSELIQLGALACSGGTGACKKLIADFNAWMDKNGYSNMRELTGDALKFFNMNKELADERIKRISDAYNNAQVRQDACIGCGRCVDVCWHDGIGIEQGKAKKKDSCIGCGYCFQVCPVKALNVDAGTILASVFKDFGV